MGVYFAALDLALLPFFLYAILELMQGKLAWIGIAVIATEATIRSRAYEFAIYKRRSHARMLFKPTPLLVPIIDNVRRLNFLRRSLLKVRWMTIAGVLITGTMMAISLKRGESSEHMSRLGMVLGGCVLVATAGPLVGFVFN